jgi:hypothetical protein
MVVPVTQPLDTPVAVSSPEDHDSMPATVPRRGRWTPRAELLKRVFLVDVLVCPECSGRMRILVAILDKNSIQAILRHCGFPTGPPAIVPSLGRQSSELPEEPPGDFFADPPAPDES